MTDGANIAGSTTVQVVGDMSPLAAALARAEAMVRAFDAKMARVMSGAGLNSAMAQTAAVADRSAASIAKIAVPATEAAAKIDKMTQAARGFTAAQIASFQAQAAAERTQTGVNDAFGIGPTAKSAEESFAAFAALDPELVKATEAHAHLSTQSMAASHAMRGMVEQIAMGVSPAQALTAQMNHLSFAASGEGGIIGAFEGVGATLSSMLTLPNLLTVGIIGLVVAIPSLWEAISGASEQEAELALERQKKLVDDLAAAYPNLAKSLKPIWTRGRPRPRTSSSCCRRTKSTRRNGGSMP